MLIKKYLIEKNSIFNKSIILPFFEDDCSVFLIDGYEGFNKKELFNPNFIKKSGKTGDIDVSKLPISCAAIYLNEAFETCALIIKNDNNHKYYCFRVDPQKPNILKIQSNYILDNLEDLTKDYETSGSRRKTYKGLAKFEEIKDLNYFETLYEETIKKQENKSAQVSKLIFNNSSAFIVDFARLIERDEIKIDSDNVLTKKEINRDILSRHIVNRNDVILINKEKKDIEYFIYTYKPQFINRFYLFKKLNNKEYQLIAKSISINKLLNNISLKDIKYKSCSLNISKALINVRFEDFYKEFVEFELFEEFDESLKNENLNQKIQEEEIKNKGYDLPKEIKNILDKYNFENVDGFLYFKDYETMPLGFLDNTSINLYENRSVYGDIPLKRFKFKSIEQIENHLNDLFNNQPSSRLLILNNLIEKAVRNYNEAKEEQLNLIEEIESIYKTLWPSDKNEYSRKYLSSIMKKFSSWKENNKNNISKIFKNIENVENLNVNLSLHASLRIEERIGIKSELDKLNIAKAAYKEGKTAWHFYDSLNDDFKVLSYLQSKHPDREIRLYKGFVFVYDRKEPHTLVTCLSYKESFDSFTTYHVNSH